MADTNSNSSSGTHTAVQSGTHNGDVNNGDVSKTDNSTQVLHGNGVMIKGDVHGGLNQTFN